MNTIDDKRIVGARTLSELYTWIDADYSIYNNMKGHNGGAISMGYGLIHRKSSESELVGTAEYISYNI